MSRFDNKTCPVCRTPLTEKSDVVVCPICGTPHHRACYMKYNRCGLESLHESGFVWNGCLPDEQQSPPAEGSEANAADPHVGEYPQGASGTVESDSFGGAFINGQRVDAEHIEDFLNNLRNRTMDDRRGEDGVSRHELSCFVGKSVMHYVQAFDTFRAPAAPGERHKHVFFNFCAGLFLPIHQFYRRLDLLGIGLLVLEMCAYLPTILSVAGIGNEAMLSNIQVISSMVNLAAMICMSLFGDYIYYRFCVRKIKKIRASYDDGKAEGYYEALYSSGCPSWLRAVIGVLLVYFAEACIIVSFSKFMT